MKIKNYTNDDYSEIVSILKDSDLFDEVWDSEDNLNSLVAKNPQSILVAEDQGKVIGNIFIIPYGKKVSYLFRLAVKKEFRKQGIASALIRKAEEIVNQGEPQNWVYMLILEILICKNFIKSEILRFRKKPIITCGRNYRFAWSLTVMLS